MLDGILFFFKFGLNIYSNNLLFYQLIYSFFLAGWKQAEKNQTNIFKKNCLGKSAGRCWTEPNKKKTDKNEHLRSHFSLRSFFHFRCGIFCSSIRFSGSQRAPIRSECERVPNLSIYLIDGELINHIQRSRAHQYSLNFLLKIKQCSMFTMWFFFSFFIVIIFFLFNLLIFFFYLNCCSVFLNFIW